MPPASSSEDGFWCQKQCWDLGDLKLTGSATHPPTHSPFHVPVLVSSAIRFLPQLPARFSLAGMFCGCVKVCRRPATPSCSRGGWWSIPKGVVVTVPCTLLVLAGYFSQAVPDNPGSLVCHVLETGAD